MQQYYKKKICYNNYNEKQKTKFRNSWGSSSYKK